MVREKKSKFFSGARVPEWLWIELVKYSKKHKVSHARMTRDALKNLVLTGRSLLYEDGQVTSFHMKKYFPQLTGLWRTKKEI